MFFSVGYWHGRCEKQRNVILQKCFGGRAPLQLHLTAQISATLSSEPWCRRVRAPASLAPSRSQIVSVTCFQGNPVLWWHIYFLAGLPGYSSICERLVPWLTNNAVSPLKHQQMLPLLLSVLPLHQFYIILDFLKAHVSGTDFIIIMLGFCLVVNPSLHRFHWWSRIQDGQMCDWQSRVFRSLGSINEEIISHEPIVINVVPLIYQDSIRQDRSDFYLLNARKPCKQCFKIFR